MASASFSPIVGPQGPQGDVGPTGATGSNPDPTTSIPIAGDTVTATATGLTKLWYITPAGTLATLTLTLDDGTEEGQCLIVLFSKIITALTVSPSNIVTPVALPTAAAVGDYFIFIWDSNQSKWIKVK